ncbi:hypothetical protein [Microvirga sesbaniae]|uniref:hypothetical protein n=1 Tax=Microvirga sesbaniae TaxID=681392 RepID=UPI0021C6BF0F|nr:hypothetical protein [Microvirga sp. HBU67692]
MQPSIAACLILLAGTLAPAIALAADSERPLPETDLTAPFHTKERTYFREHRLRAYERSRADMRQGATCTTPKGVCWIAEPLSKNSDCTCESRRFGTVHGTIGG